MIKFFSTILFTLIYIPLAASAGPTIMTSIKPVAMLIKAVVGDEIPVEVLLSGNVSPHDYKLKFSDIRAIRSADFFVWVGPGLESHLSKAIENYPSANVIQLTTFKNIQWPETSILEHQEDTHNYKNHHSLVIDGQDSNLYNLDPHLWLNPENSLQVVNELKRILSHRYPEYKAVFKKNVEIFSVLLKTMDGELKEKFRQVKERGFIVEHDGYGHFIEHYGLRQLGIIDLMEGVSITARHRARLETLSVNAACIFTYPQRNNKIADQLAEKFELNSRGLDAMGRNVSLGQGSYIEFFNDFSATVLTCLE
tara:strand:+ start:19082 stop:20008 length:927 start_codon:yes stop_codon:yes gene_type:complete